MNRFDAPFRKMEIWKLHFVQITLLPGDELLSIHFIDREIQFIANWLKILIFKENLIKVYLMFWP